MIGDITITVGYVQVAVPVWDADGVQRIVAFPRIGKTMGMAAVCHWTARRFIAEARSAAANHLKRWAAKQ